MTFKEMEYERPDAEKLKAEIEGLTKELEEALNYKKARDVFLKYDKLERHIMTFAELASIRHSIDTRDKFYDEETKFWNRINPEIQECSQKWLDALLSSKFRKQFEDEFGSIVFINAEMQRRTFSPDIIAQLQQEADLVKEYHNIIASAQIPFEGNTYTLSQLTPFKNDADDERRLAAWKAEGSWYKENQKELDEIYDKLVHLRDEMGRKLGHENYIPLGYDRMERNCYSKEDVEKFRAAVIKHLVPIATKIRKSQAENLGMEYPLSFSDMQLEFREGNPKPKGDADDILKAGRKFYDELSPETGKFFRKMLDMEMLDVLSTEGKEGGGYCTLVPDYHMPFIFANFNGTQGDVEVVTHEAGHAFEAYLNENRIPNSTIWAGMEGSEVHSMSMEFFAWGWAEDFFGDDAEKYLYSHLAAALTFIPYGTMVDHFQHRVYEKPNMTPRQRHDVWKELLGVYMPWVRLDGDIPFYAEGEGWQRQQHIYASPFYYIDYCLAQTVSLEFWAMIQEDRKNAWKHYMLYTRQGGSDTFVNMLKNASLRTPFDEACLQEVSETAQVWLSKQKGFR